MFRNYLLIAFRSLRRHVVFTAINVVGLSLSMAVGLLLILFVREQASKDDFHQDGDRIYRVYSDFKSQANRDNALYATSPANLSPILAEEIPGIERAVKLRRGFGGTISYGDVGLSISGLYADPVFLDVFAFDLAAGDPATALVAPHSVILAPESAIKFFGDADPLGEVLSVEGQGDFTVTGVFDRDDYRSHLPLAAIASYATLESEPETGEMLNNWTRSIYRSYTYIRLEEGVSASDVQTRIDHLLPVYFAERDDNRLHALHMQPLSSINLGTMMGNEIGNVLPGGVAYFLSALAIIILLIACFNYVGLTVSRSLKRAREVGVRKLFGARRLQVFGQFLTETLVVSFVALLVAIVLLAYLVPGFNSLTFVNMTGTALEVNFGADPGLYVVLFAFMGSVAVVAGLYPALYLSSFQPARAMKGMSVLSGAGGSKLRKSLVVAQFTFSVVFVVITTTMFSQSKFMLNADYGFEQEQIVNVQLFSVPYANFRQELATSTNIQNVSGTGPLPAMGSRRDRWLRTAEMDEPVKGYAYDIDEHFVENLELTLLSGRNLSPDFGSDADRTVLVNETFVDWLGLGSVIEAVGKVFVMGDSTEMQIAGVLKNYQTNIVTEESSPTLWLYAPERVNWANVRITPGRFEEAIDDIRAAWTNMGYTRALEFERFDLQIRNNFANLLMKDAMKLVGFIALLALVIACLGLLGIATYNVERRTREISIRKVLGASAGTVVGLLSREFVWLMAVSLVVALPLSWLLSSQFLQSFARRIEMGPGIFLFGTVSIIALALLVTGTQTVRAALQDPVNNLYEE